MLEKIIIKSNYQYVGIKCFKFTYSISTCYVGLIRTSVIGCTLYKERERDSERVREEKSITSKNFSSWYGNRRFNYWFNYFFITQLSILKFEE